MFWIDLFEIVFSWSILWCHYWYNQRVQHSNTDIYMCLKNNLSHTLYIHYVLHMSIYFHLYNTIYKDLMTLISSHLENYYLFQTGHNRLLV